MNNLRILFPVRPLISDKINLILKCSRCYCKTNDETPELGSLKKPASGTEGKGKSKERLTRLNSLLKEMIEDSPKNAPTPIVELSKPKSKRAKLRETEGKESNVEAPKKKENDIVEAAKEVAQSLGGDTKATESELLKKLLGTNEEKTDALTSLSDIFKGMKIDRGVRTDRGTPQVEQRNRSEQVRQLLLNKNLRREQPRQERNKYVVPDKKKITKLDVIDLYGSPPLGIFTSDPKEYTETVNNATWEAISKRELKLLGTHPPSNYFQQMILWTEQGKLWKFPIDNEQGLEEENNISFAEHIFLDKHLDPWCPQKGPLRHFMELVCVGLSKNPYLTVTAKVEHINWYRDYFEDKRSVLQNAGVALNEPTVSQ